MGLNRELRTLNNNILTDKQQRQIDRQERQQLKNLQLVDQAHKKTLQLFIKSKIQYYLSLNFTKYKSDLFLLTLKNEIQQDFIKKNKGYEDIILLYFDDFYYKELKKQIKIFEMNLKATTSNAPPLIASPKSNSHGLFWLIFTIANLINFCLAGFKTKRRF